MKVAFLNRERSAYPGGDVLSIDETITALAPLGVEATYIDGQWQPHDLDPFDLIHVKHLNFSWSKFNFDQVWASGRPYVIQPVFYSRTDLGMDTRDMSWAIGRARAVIPYTWAEWRAMRERIPIEPATRVTRVQCVPNGTAWVFHDVIQDGRGLDVLCVAARGGKGADTVEAICKERDWSFRCATDVPYYAMPAIYRNAKVFVSASDGDRMSRTVGEALCAGCRVISSDKNWANVYYPGLWTYPYVTSDVTYPQALDALMAEALAAEAWDYRPNEAARLLTWPLVANLLRVVYEEALR